MLWWGNDNDVYFVSFADSKYKATLERIKNEANIFKHVFTYDENTCDISKNKKFIEENSKRGYGYWIWKPQIIRDTLEKIPDGSYLVYADAGCTIQKNAIFKVNDILSKIDEKGLVAFKWRKNEPECMWSKMDTIQKIYPEAVDDERPSLIATYIYFKKNENSLKFVNEWLTLCESDNYHHIDDSPSNEPNCDLFIEHRHDQSIFSLLCHKYGVKILDEGFFPPPISHSRRKF